MEAIDTLTIVNILMTCGIVATLIAIRQIGKENKALHEQNFQQRLQDRKEYRECVRSYRRVAASRKLTSEYSIGADT